MLTRLYELLSSWKLSVVLTVSGALYAGFLTVWGASSPAHVIRTISGMIPFQILYALLLLNTLFCLIRRWRRLVSRMGVRPSLLPASADWSIPVTEPPEGRGWKVMEDSRFRIIHRWSALGTLLFHVAMFPLAAGFYLSRGRYEGSFTAGLGEKVRVETSRLEAEKLPSGSFVGIRPFDLEVKDIDAHFWGDELLFTRFTAEIRVNGAARSVAINKPVWLSPFTSLRITSFSYAPSYMVVIPGLKEPLEQGAVKMRLFPPGKRDYFYTRHFPHRIYVRLYPDFTGTEETPRSRSMRPDNPRFLVEVYRGKVFIVRKLIRPGETLTVETFSLALLEIFPTVRITLVRDPGMPWIFTGFLTALTGMILRLPGRRGEILCKPAPGGGYMLLGAGVPEAKA